MTEAKPPETDLKHTTIEIKDEDEPEAEEPNGATEEEKTVQKFIDSMAPHGVSVYMHHEQRHQRRGDGRGGRFFGRPKYYVATAEAFEDDKWARRVFISTVYSILLLQLAFTIGVIALFVFITPCKLFAIQHWYLIFVWLCGYFIMYFSLVCYEVVRLSYPTNVVIVTFMTIFMALMLGFFSAIFKAEYVLIALGMTTLVVLLISLLARTGLFDFTGCGLVLVVFSICLCVFGLITVIVVLLTGSKVMMLVYCGIAMAVVSLYLIYDTQLILGGRRIELGTDEYLLGAIQLYVDICYIFQLILICLGLGLDS